MSRSVNLVKNTAIYAVGNFASKLLSVVLLPIYTVCLNPEDFGQVDLYVSGASLLLPLVSLQIIDAAYRYMLDDEREYSYGQIITTTGCLYLAGFSLLCVAVPILFAVFGLPHCALYLVYMFTTFTCQGMQQIVRGLKRNSIYAIAGVLITLVQGIVNIVLITFLDTGAASLLLAPAVASIAGMLFICDKVKLISYINPRFFSKNLLFKMTKYSLPLCVHSLCWWFISSAGSYFLAASTGGTEQSGVYAMGVKFTQIMAMFNTIFFLAWQESAVDEFSSADRDEYYSRTYETIFRFQTGCLIVLLPLIRLYFMVMPDNDFASCQSFLPLMLLSNVLMASISFFTSIFTASKETKPVLFSSIFAFVCALLAYILLVPGLGAFGVVIGSSAAYLALLSIRAVMSRRLAIIRLKPSGAMLSSLCILLTCLGYYCLQGWEYLLLLVSSICMFLIINHDLVLGLFKLIRSKSHGC